jgi:hypothetical protein
LQKRSAERKKIRRVRAEKKTKKRSAERKKEFSVGACANARPRRIFL